MASKVLIALSIDRVAVHQHPSLGAMVVSPHPKYGNRARLSALFRRDRPV